MDHPTLVEAVAVDHPTQVEVEVAVAAAVAEAAAVVEVPQAVADQDAGK